MSRQEPVGGSEPFAAEPADILAVHASWGLVKGRAVIAARQGDSRSR